MIAQKDSRIRDQEKRDTRPRSKQCYMFLEKSHDQDPFLYNLVGTCSKFYFIYQ